MQFCGYNERPKEYRVHQMSINKHEIEHIAHLAKLEMSDNDLSGLDSSFFDSVNYVGAVSDQDTSSAWYKWGEAAVNAANND